MRKAMILLEGFGKAGRKPTPTDAARVQELLREALDESQLVRDDVLVKIHPEYAKMYREKYVNSLTRLMALFEAEAPDPDELAAILGALDEWSEWRHAHRNELRVPKGLPDE